MSDNEGTRGQHEEEQQLQGEIEKEIKKLKYFLEETEELIENKDYTEIEIVTRRAEKIVEKITDLISHTEELKIDGGASSRTVRQWKKDVKSNYAALIADKEKLSGFLKNRRDEMEQALEQRRTESKHEQQRQEERRAIEFRETQEEHERRMWQEKLDAELDMAKKKLELEQSVRSTTAKLPKLKITPFKGTPTDWVQFRNMFATQVP